MGTIARVVRTAWEWLIRAVGDRVSNPRVLRGIWIVCIGSTLLALFALTVYFAGREVKFASDAGFVPRAVATVLVGVSVVVTFVLGVLGNECHRRMVDRLKRAENRAYAPSTLLQNHDLTRAVGEAIGVLLADLADPPLGGASAGSLRGSDPPELRGLPPLTEDARAWLRATSKTAPERWAAVVARAEASPATTPLESLRERNLCRFVRDPAAPTLTDPNWAETIRALAAPGNPAPGNPAPFDPSSDDERRIVARVRSTFGRALWEVLKNDAVHGGYQAKGMELAVSSELLRQVEALAARNSDAGVVARLDAMNSEWAVHAEAVEAKLTQLGRESRESLRHVKEIHAFLPRLREAIDSFRQENRAAHEASRAREGETQRSVRESNEQISRKFDELEALLKGQGEDQVRRGNISREYADQAESLGLQAALDAMRLQLEDATSALNQTRREKDDALRQVASLSPRLSVPEIPPSPKIAAIEAYNLGVIAREQGSMERAIAHYTVALSYNPKLKEALNNRGNARQSSGDLDGALEDFSEAIRLDPAYKQALNNRGIARKKRRDLPGALADYDAALTIDPEYKRALNNRGNARK